MMDIRPFQEKWIVEHYNFMTGSKVKQTSEIPTPQLKRLYLFSYKELLAPLVREELINGNGRPSIAVMYGLTENEVRSIGRDLNIYKKRGGASSPTT